MRTSTIISSAISFVFACASVTAVTGAASAAASSATLLLPAGTTVTLVPKGTGGMAAVHNVGDEVDFTVKKAVIVDGWVVIPEGAPAHGTISDLTSMGVHFGGGISQASLHFAFDWIQLTAGKLRLDNAPVEVKGRQIKRTVSTIFGKKDTPNAGMDPFLTAEEYGVEATTASAVHIPSTQRATALEQAEQSGTFIDK